MVLAPIVLFCYNRPFHVRQTLEALSRNDLADESMLYIFCDGPKENASEEQLQKIVETRSVIKEKKWCKDIIITEREKNRGLANSVIEGVTDIINQYGKVIVLEDDLITGKGFLTYMNDALSYYKSKDQVMSVSGFSYLKNSPGVALDQDVYLLPLICSWGWGTWQRAWAKFRPDDEALYNKIITTETLTYRFDCDGTFPYTAMLTDQLNGKLDSWAVRWYAATFIHNGLSLYPKYSFVKNSGYDDTATHTKSKDPFEDNPFADSKRVLNIVCENIETDQRLFRLLKQQFLSLKPSQIRTRKFEMFRQFLKKVFKW